MPLQNWERHYPILHDLFGEHSEILVPSHPLGYLVSIDAENVRRAAHKTEAAARVIRLGACCPTLYIRITA
jgi:hypothetical protein